MGQDTSIMSEAAAAGTRRARAVTLHRRALRLEHDRKSGEALACQRQAVEVAPRTPLIHLELGRLLLRRGQFTSGLNAFDTYWRLKGRFNGLPRFSIPQWDGRRLPGGRILLIADQGAGDAIQFARDDFVC
jgi:hypothetical protein